MYKQEIGYLDLLQEILSNGSKRGDRTGTGTRSIFSACVGFDLREGFPLLTTKKMATNAIIGELLWFLSGDSNLSALRYHTYGDANSDKKTIWDDNIKAWDAAGESGGLLYGVQWRNFAGSSYGPVDNWVEPIYNDQVSTVLDEAKRNPESRRLIVDAWNAAEIYHKEMALPPCHFAWQLYIDGDYIDLKWNQRSVDTFLGLPFNIASYATLLSLFGKWLNKQPRMLVGDLTNVHIYENHIDAVNTQLRNIPIACRPKLHIPSNIRLDNLHKFTAKDFYITDYCSHNKIFAPMAV